MTPIIYIQKLSPPQDTAAGTASGFWKKRNVRKERNASGSNPIRGGTRCKACTLDEETKPGVQTKERKRYGSKRERDTGIKKEKTQTETGCAF